MTTHKTARDPVKSADVEAIQPHPAWADGRRGFVWCRFDAVLTEDERHLRAEVTWNDDSEFEDNKTGKARTYFDPELWIETNYLDSADLKTYDGFRLPLSHSEAVAIVMFDPKDLLEKYAEKIAALKIRGSV